MVRNIQKVLCVAEKNDAARGIADILSNSRMRRVGARNSDIIFIYLNVVFPTPRFGWRGVKLIIPQKHSTPDEILVHKKNHKPKGCTVLLVKNRDYSDTVIPEEVCGGS